MKKGEEMKQRNRGFINLLLVFLCFCLYCSDSLTQNLKNPDRESIEKFLKTAKVVSIEKGRGRRTESWIVKLDDGKIQGRGFFKLVDRHRPNPSGGDCYEYVLASYELDKMLDLNLVPPTVERKIERRKGSLMLFLEPPVMSEEDRMQKNLVPPDPVSFNKTLSDLVIFEHLLFFPSLCSQRDLGNILIQTEKNWKVWMVDLSEAFAPAMRLITGCEITDCSDNLFHKLENLNRDGIQVRLGKYLNDEEISALLVRKDLIIKKVKELRKSN
jgi:hypothetical protein